MRKIVELELPVYQELPSFFIPSLSFQASKLWWHLSNEQLKIKGLDRKMLLTQFLSLLMTYLQSQDIVHIFYVVTYTYLSLVIVQMYSTITGQNVQDSSLKNTLSTGISSRYCEMTYCSSLKFHHLLELLDVRGKFLKSVQSSPEIQSRILSWRSKCDNINEFQGCQLSWWISSISDQFLVFL